MAGLGGAEGSHRGYASGYGEGRISPPPAPGLLPHPLTVEELRLDMEELLLSIRSSEGSGPGASSPFSRISDASWV